MERRKFFRNDVRDEPIKTKLLLTAQSLLNEDSVNVVEINARPINLSEGGICLALGMEASWQTFSPMKIIELMIEKGMTKTPLKGKVVRVETADHLLGLEFSTPFTEVTNFLTPTK